MKKIIIAHVLFLIAFLSSQAQSELTCWQGKSIRHSLPKKKHRAGAYANSLMNKYDVHFYFLDINAERNTTVLSGTTTIGAIVIAPIDTFCFELNPNLTIDSITWGSQTLSFSRVGAIAYALFPSTQPGNTNIAVKIYYHGNASVIGAGALGDGYTTGTSPSWGNQVTWSLSEPYSAYEWFPCKQFLQDKADSSWVHVTTDNENKVGSNGLLVGVDSLPGNKIKYKWRNTYPIDYYLISVAIATYIDYTIYAHPAALAGDSIPVVNYVYNNPGTLPQFKNKIDSIPMMLEYFSELFGLYPFHNEKYGHAMAPLGGGMEHQTMSTMGNLGGFAINAHELAHQWWGDHVTCKTWKDIFINEGFASYCEYLAYEKFRSPASANSRMAAIHNDILADPDAMVYFTDTTDVGRIFDGLLTYDKGAAVAHTLRFVLGDTLFFSGLRHFQTTYSHSTASINDLKTNLESFTGVSLSDYFNQWLFGAGYPIYSVQYFSNGSNIFLKVSHSTSTLITPVFKGPLELLCKSPSGDTLIKIDITSNTDSYILPSTKNITGVEVDPRNWLLNKVGTISMNPDLISLSSPALAWQHQVNIYPVPSSNELHIDLPQHVQITYSLYDILGNKVQQGTLVQKNMLYLQSLPSGVYHLELTAPNSPKYVHKVVKQ